MARPTRNNRPGTVYHHISRIVDRSWLIADESARALYLRLLGRAFSSSDWLCLAYAVMSNHIHLCTVAGKQKLERWAKRVHSPFARWMNDRYDRLGSKFVRGPKDYAIPPERVARVIAYIHNNPVRAKVVAHPSDSNWTSHQAYTGLVPAPAWLAVAEGLRRAGFSSPEAFDRFVARNPDDPDIREALARDFRRADIEAEAPPSPSSFDDVPADPAAIVRATAKVVGISVAQLASKRRGAREVLGRQVAVACAERTGLAGTAIARALNITQGAASAILRRARPPEELIEAVLGSDISCATYRTAPSPPAGCDPA